MYKQYKQFKQYKSFKQYKLYRLFILFTTLWLLGFTSSAVAQASGDQYYVSKYTGGSPAAACTAALMSGDYGSKTMQKVGPVTPNPPGYVCDIVDPNNGSHIFYMSVGVRQVSCTSPDVYNAATGSCGAPAGPQCNTPKGQTVSWTQVDTGYPKSSPTCGLTDIPTVIDCFSKGSTNYCKYEGQSNGANAPSNASPDAGVGRDPTDPQGSTSTSADSKGACPNGTVAAGVDSGGTTICIGTGTSPGGSSKPTPTSTTTKNTDSTGKTTETTTTTSTNSDGSKTTTTVVTTIGVDGTKSVTGSTTTGTTATGTTGKQDQPNDLCKANPNLTICRNSSVSGTCGQTTCTGDAIQCATLRAAAAMQCAQAADEKAIKESSFKNLGDSIMSGNDPMKGQIDAMLKGKEIDLSKSKIDQGGFLGGGSCIPNKSFSVMGQSITVEFDRICNDIQPIRAIIMLLSFIAAYSIVIRTILTL